jgi:hypothetical protein
MPQAHSIVAADASADLAKISEKSRAAWIGGG